MYNININNITKIATYRAAIAAKNVTENFLQMEVDVSAMEWFKWSLNYVIEFQLISDIILIM